MIILENIKNVLNYKTLLFVHLQHLKVRDKE